MLAKALMDCCKWKYFFLFLPPSWHEFACAMHQAHYLLAAAWESCVDITVFVRFLSRAKRRANVCAREICARVGRTHGFTARLSYCH